MSAGPGSPEVRIGEASDVVEVLAADLEACVRISAPERAFTLAIPGGSVAARCNALRINEETWMAKKTLRGTGRE